MAKLAEAGPPRGEGAHAWTGEVALHYAQVAGRTQIQHDYAKAPYRVQRPFYPEGDRVCHTVLLHTAGGMVGGDRLQAHLHLGEQANVLITTASAGKVYRSLGPTTHQQIRIQIAEGAILEWLPQETIVFDQANYHQHLHVDLAPTGQWLGWDILRLGRSARGERFLAGTVRQHTEVWQAGVPLWIDRQWLPGSRDSFETLHGLAGQPVVGSLAWLGQAVSPDLVQAARALGPRCDFGVSRLPLGLICRYRGHSSQEARLWFSQVWQLIRRTGWQRPPCPVRIWS
jgi:urease accessory protein